MKIPYFLLGPLAQLIEGELTGDPSIELKGFNPSPEKANSNEICFVFSKKYIELLNTGELKAGAYIVPLDAKITVNVARIAVKNPKLVIKKLLELFAPKRYSPEGIHPSAVIDPSAKLGEDVKIGANVFIGPESEIGDNTQIQANVSIGAKVKIGKNCILKYNCVIEDECIIGNKVIIHPGTVIGSDGFSYVTEEETIIDKLKKSPTSVFNAEELSKDINTKPNPYLKVISAGNVVIEDNVEIGANTCIDRGTLGATFIGENTKIDNLVQIAHNCQIGKDCLLIGQCGIAGSVKIGNRTVIAGQAGCRDNITIGSDCLLMAASHVHKDIAAFSILGGTPAVSPKEYLEKEKAPKKALREINKLKKAIEELKS